MYKVNYDDKRYERRYKELDRLIKQDTELDIDGGKGWDETNSNLLYRRSLLRRKTNVLKKEAVVRGNENPKYYIIALTLQRRHHKRKPIQ